MKKIGSKNPWVLLILMLAGIVLGGFIGTLTQNISWLNWLNYGQEFGLAKNSPLVLDLGILVVTFALSIKITISSIIGMIIAAIVYRFI